MFVKDDTFKKKLPRFFQYLVLSIVTADHRGAHRDHGLWRPQDARRDVFTPLHSAHSPALGKLWSDFGHEFVLVHAAQQSGCHGGNDVGVVVASSLAAFVFARMQFRGKELAFNFLTLGLMFPITVAIMPVYLVIRQMQLIDSLVAVILVQTAFGIAGNTLILRGFFLSIPVELQDAASIDGCSTFGFFWRILLPLAKPALAAVAALTMIVSWNDLLTPLVLLNSDSLWTLPLGTMQFQGQYSSDLALTAAFVTLSALPAIIFYIFAERQIVTGLTAGALKG